jgi:hypothetical protein
MFQQHADLDPSSHQARPERGPFFERRGSLEADLSVVRRFADDDEADLGKELLAREEKERRWV